MPIITRLIVVSLGVTTSRVIIGTELPNYFVTNTNYDYKLNAELSPSRQAVVCTPDIAARERAHDKDMYLLLVCNRIWDVMC